MIVFARHTIEPGYGMAIRAEVQDLISSLFAPAQVQAAQEVHVVETLDFDIVRALDGAVQQVVLPPWENAMREAREQLETEPLGLLGQATREGRSPASYVCRIINRL